MPVLTERQQRRKKNERAFKRERARIGQIKAIEPERDPLYLAWLRLQPCTVFARFGTCHCRDLAVSYFLRVIEAAHTEPHGMNQKASDYDAIPLCRWMHQEAKDEQAKSRNWFAEHGLNRKQIIAGLRARYEQERAA
jgi:hypothetical protein